MGQLMQITNQRLDLLFVLIDNTGTNRDYMILIMTYISVKLYGFDKLYY